MKTANFVVLVLLAGALGCVDSEPGVVDPTPTRKPTPGDTVIPTPTAPVDTAVAEPVDTATTRVDTANVPIDTVVAPAPVPTELTFEPWTSNGLKWFKGNTHAHSTASDGDSPPAEVARMYRERGYNFLVLSDHDVLVPPQSLTIPQDPAFLMIAGEEISSWYGGPIHVTAIGLTRTVGPIMSGSSTLEVLQRTVDVGTNAGGIAVINHPNFFNAFGATTIMSVRGASLMEIYNGHPLTYPLGVAGRPSYEVMWDSVLTTSRRVFGVATDDSHHIKGADAPQRAYLGRAWVVVAAPELTTDGILAGLRTGRFYSSTGVSLDDVTVEKRSFTVVTREEAGYTYRTDFVGLEGRVLASTTSNPAIFRLGQERGYVRAKVYRSDGKVAWTQPFFIQ